MEPIDYGRWIDPWHYEGGTPKQRREERRRLAEDLALRADIQHSLVLAGDPRGVFGDYPPSQLFSGLSKGIS